MKKAAIIIPIYENYNLFTNFIQNLYKRVSTEKYKIILAFDGPMSKHTLSELDKINMQYDKIETTNSVGFSKINNLALKCIKEEIIIFMNSDIIVEEKSLDALVKVIENDIAELVQPLLIYPQTETVQSTGHIFGDCFNMHALQNRKITDDIVQTSTYRQALSLALCAMKKEVIQEIGLLNEEYYHGWEGLEYTLKAHTLGFRLYYLADAFAYHIQGGSSSNLMNRTSYQGNYFWKCWGEHIKMDIDATINLQLKNMNIQQLGYLAIDLTDHLIWKRILKSCNINTQEYISFVNTAQHDIDLFKTLPNRTICNSMPILFLTKSFTQICNNKIWFRYRNNENDICLDMSGNAIFTKFLFPV